MPVALETKCYLCVHVADAQRPVLLVTRPAGDWCLTCGDEHVQDASSFRVGHLAHPIAEDPTLRSVLDLGINQEAERSRMHARWNRSPMPRDAV